ncbi:MAG TPA: 3-deoxy-7-phosphoheptulonate synthase [Gammaproteobacteria bacterium]|nr:3-deoxy-7-phosphoheptulonate synthase [Gammaproteobacteria bacterium]
MNQPLSNINIVSEDVLLSPQELRQRVPRSDQASQTVEQSRRAVEAILDRKDHRLLVVTGPCSIHDVDAAKEYAERLKALHDRYADTLYIVMRVYFEKPRTSVGWKGLINDPYLDDSFQIEDGLVKARELLVSLAELGLPTGTEALDPISPQYLADLFSWSAIGARTTESQTHREMASGLSTSVGFKNGTDGGLDVAINAMKSASSPHRFLGINAQGQVTVIQTRGNQYGHVILRGGRQSNYDVMSIRAAEEALEKAGLSNNIIVDCSHANSNKDPAQQPIVVSEVAKQIVEGNQSIIGLMLESHLKAGNQPLSDHLEYGVSITDGCISWETTEETLQALHERLREALPARLQNPA